MAVMVGNFPAAAKCISRACLLLALFLALFSSYAWPQTQLATIFGTITDATGAAISGAQVTILNQSTGLKRDAPTDSTGQYHIAGLPTGTYSVRVEKEGFQSQVREGIALTSASEIMMNLSLSVGDLKQQLTVRADVPTIDNTTSTVSGLLPEQSLTELPLDGRDLLKAAILERGVAPTPSSAPSLLSTGKAGQVSINGMRPSWTNVLIDGMDANDPVFGYSPAGASGLFLGLNEFTEVRVLTQTFNAEYGRNGGGVVEAVTRSGSNQFHGSLFELYRDASLDAKNYFDLGNAPIPPFVRNQFGASIGGPVVHDRTFFFANYEGFREVQASTAISTVPNALARQGLLPTSSNPGACTNATPNGCVSVGVDPRVQQFLALIPPTNGADNGDGTGDLITANKGDTNEHHGMIRVDHNFSNTHSLFGRYIIDDSSSLVPYFGTPPGTYVPGFPALHQARNEYFSVQDRRNIGHEIFNELRFGINRTTASTSIVDTHPGLSISLVPGRPFGTIDIAGMSLVGNSAVIPNPVTDSGPTVGKVFAGTPADLLSPQAGFAWNIFGDGETVLRGGSGIFRDQFPVILLGIDRFLPPFFSINSLIFPSFPSPQNAVLTQPLFLIQTTYHPKFPYTLQYNINLERGITRGTILSAGYFGARGNHLTRAGEQNPFEPALGHRFNPNLSSPLEMVLTDAQSFYNSFQLSVSRQHTDSLSWQVFYTFSHSIDDASNTFLIDAVNEPESQDIFNRKGSRGRSGFDIRHNFVGNVLYELPFGRRSWFGGWQLSGIASVHSNVPFTPVLSFGNADLQSVVIAERPNLIGNPYSGVCPNGTRVGTPACWFNPSAFALPPPGQFGNAGRNILRGPGFAQLDVALQKGFQLTEGTKITFGAEAYNLLNHPNFAVPSNTQNPIALGGNGDAVFRDVAGHFANNVGRIFTTVSTGRQIQFDARFTF